MLPLFLFSVCRYSTIYPVGDYIMNDDEQVKMIRCHSHARTLYRLWHDLQQEIHDGIYNTDERRILKQAIAVLQGKEYNLKKPYLKTEEWNKLGDYTLFR